MSRPEAIDVEALRARLEYALRFDVQHEGTLYLRVLACILLACDKQSDAEEATLEALYYQQASFEDVDGDDVLTESCLVVPSRAPSGHHA